MSEDRPALEDPRESREPPDTRSVSVFISYSKDSDAHCQRVLAFADTLYEGITTKLDQYEPHPEEGRATWMQRQIVGSDFTILICTSTYLAFLEGSETGANETQWQAFLVKQKIFDAGALNSKFIPVLLEGATEQDIPLFLRQSPSYQIPAQHEDLYRHLTGQPIFPAPPVGPRRSMPPPPSKGLAIDSAKEPPPASVNVDASPRSLSSRIIIAAIAFGLLGSLALIFWGILGSEPTSLRHVACTIRFEGADQVNRGWVMQLDSGAVQSVNINGTIMSFRCPEEQCDVALIIDLHSGEIRHIPKIAVAPNEQPEVSLKDSEEGAPASFIQKSVAQGLLDTSRLASPNPNPTKDSAKAGQGDEDRKMHNPATTIACQHGNRPDYTIPAVSEMGIPSKWNNTEDADEKSWIEGTPDNDAINGTSFPDKIRGHDGNDTIYGFGGNDSISGNAGIDTLNGGEGDDLLRGGQDGDTLNGGKGNDRLQGNLGDDVLNGDEDDDLVEGGDGSDEARGQDGNDWVLGGPGNDKLLSGDGGNDHVFGGSGDDPNVRGGTGDDYVSGSSGNDHVFGDQGNDIIHGEQGVDVLAGGDDDDLISGGSGDDLIYGDSGSDRLWGGSGNDVLEGGHGDDIYIFDGSTTADSDRISGETSGSDILYFRGLSLTDLNFTTDGIDLVISTPLGGRVTITKYYLGENQIECILTQK